MNSIDLQVHSDASDGKFTPREVVVLAKENGVQVMALTDHDTVAGLPEVMIAAQEIGLKVIPGIEISAEEHGIHLLGYGLDYKNAELLAELEKAKQGRLEGAKKMVVNLQKSGFAVDWSDVLKQAGKADVIVRPHIARAILERPENKEKLSGINSVGDFIQAHLLDASPNYVKRSHISAPQAISLLRKTGGVAVWSHPPLPDFQEGEERFVELEKFLLQLIGWGLEGVEVFNSAHSEDDAEFLVSLAVKYKLLCTAGSDFHEKKVPSSPGIERHLTMNVGDYATYGFSTEDFVTKLGEVIARRNKVSLLG